jgi:hypothetical protein
MNKENANRSYQMGLSPEQYSKGGYMNLGRLTRMCRVVTVIGLMGGAGAFAAASQEPVFLGPNTQHLACAVLGEHLRQGSENLIAQHGLTYVRAGYDVFTCSPGSKVTPGSNYYFNSELRVQVEGGFVTCRGRLSAGGEKEDPNSSITVIISSISGGICRFDNK